MRVLHSSDWHLGHRLFGRERVFEHLAFLDWLLRVLVEQDIDALLIAGDIFDSANPPAIALSIWYSFLAECATACPGLRIVVVGGNHDSAPRLDAPADLLRALGVCMVGGARDRGQVRDPASMCVPLCRRGSSTVQAWVAAVPFLRPFDLPQVDPESGEDPLIEGVSQVYAQIFEHLRKAPGSFRYLAMGHLYLREGQLSQWSERKVLGGNQHAIPAQIFPDWLDYVALGHLHRAQEVSRPHIRYSGSPIPLSMHERHYRHQVMLVSWQDKDAPLGMESLAVPRTVPFVRIPSEGYAEIDEVLTQIESFELPAEPSEPLSGPMMRRFSGQGGQGPPFIELAVRVQGPDPQLQARLQDACKARGWLMSSLSLEYAGQGQGLGMSYAQKDLGELVPEQVLEVLFEQRFGTQIPNALLERFGELVDELEQSRSDV